MTTYCERCGPGLFDEPLNAASNIAFLVAAWFARRLGWRMCIGTHFLWHLLNGVVVFLAMAALMTARTRSSGAAEPVSKDAEKTEPVRPRESRFLARPYWCPLLLLASALIPFRMP